MNVSEQNAMQLVHSLCAACATVQPLLCNAASLLLYSCYAQQGTMLNKSSAQDHV
jgi:hypothetical protein